jgi:hypothetical protein
MAILFLLAILTAGYADDATPDEITVDTPATAFIRLKAGYHLENDYYIDSQGNEYGRAVLLRDRPPTTWERVKEQTLLQLGSALALGFAPFIISKLKRKREKES